MIYYKKKQISSIDDVYEKYDKREFKSPYRSTIPLIALFKNNQTPNIQFVKHDKIQDVNFIFEYETSIIKGKGRASCTDLIMKYSNSCIAIEAKRTEPPYVKVGKWLGDSINKKQVLEGWLDLINTYTDLKVNISELNDLPYQLIHRVASACSLKQQHTEVIYIGFDLKEKMTNYYLDSLGKISTILKNRVDIYLYSYKIEKSEEQINLEKRWDLGERDLSQDVINGLVNNNLMRFSEANIIKINKSN